MPLALNLLVITRTLNDTTKLSGGHDMHDDGASRRAFLRILITALGSTLMTVEWTSVVAAAHDAHDASRDTDALAKFLTETEAADVAAITAQIIPSDTTPGAREAGVDAFIDRALATFLARIAPTFRAQLTEFRAACSARHPTVPAFAALGSDQQIAFLQTVEHTPFFKTMRLLTIIGMFAMPAYGGNRDAIGWKLLGFEDRHIFMPPFGDYDRDYPGFEQTAGRA